MEHGSITKPTAHHSQGYRAQLGVKISYQVEASSREATEGLRLPG